MDYRDPLSAQEMLKQGYDPLSKPVDDLINAGRAAKALGYSEGGLARLDRDWVTRAGFDPSRGRILQKGLGKDLAGFYVHPTPATQEDAANFEKTYSLPTGTTAKPDTVNAIPQGLAGAIDEDVLNHEYTHRGYSRFIPNSTGNEFYVRRRDRDFGNPDGVVGKLARDTVGSANWYNVGTKAGEAVADLFTQEGNVNALADAAREANANKTVVRNVGPVSIMQHALKYNTPTREDQAAHAKALQAGRELTPVTQLKAPTNAQTLKKPF